MRTSILNAAAGTLLAVAGAGAAMWQTESAAQQPAATQSSTARGVTVKVTPRSLTSAGWEFAVVLDTHSEDLKDDLERSAVLSVSGREYTPSGWQGPAAGGHHREGLLRFPAPDGGQSTVELRLTRPGEATPRVFRWEGLQPN